MKKIFAFTVAALSLLAVSCNKEVAPEATRMVSKTFTVSAPEQTKTELSGTKSVLWSDGDQISVIAKTSQKSYTFDLVSGAGSANAKFEGQIDEADADETEFYAVYPASAVIDPADKNHPLSSGDLTVKTKLATDVPAILDGFSPEHALMTAVSDADGNFAFRHGMAYLKIKVALADVKTLKFSVTGAPRGGRPSYAVSDGTTTDVQGAQRVITLKPEGTFTQDGTYYLPVMTKQSNLGILTLEFTKADGDVASIKTSSLEKVKLQSGLIYDLGSPSVSFDPEIVADNTSIDAVATFGSIAYEIVNAKSGGALTAALKESCDWLTVGEVVDDAVNLTLVENTAEARSTIVVLTYTWSGGSVEKEVTVTQKGASGVSENYVWDFSSAEWVEELGKYNQNKDLTNWTISLNGLTWNSVQKSKWNIMTIAETGESFYYIQVGGASKPADNDRVFSFSVANPGTVTVKASNTGSSEDTARKVCVLDSTGTEQSKTGGVPSTNPVELTFDVAAGDVMVYVSASLRIYKIEFHN